MSKKLNKKRDFANDIVITGDTYAGIHAMPYVTAAVKSPDTVAKGYVRTIDGITKSAVINNIASSAPIVAGPGGVSGAGACSFSAGDNITTTEQVLTLTDLKVNEQICRGTVFPTWMGQGMNRNGELPQSFSDFVLSTVAGAAGQQIENGIWLADAGGTFGTGLLSDDGVFDATGFAASQMQSFHTVESVAPVTGAGALTFFEEVYSKVASNVPGIMNKPGFGFYVGNQVYALYLSGLATAGGNGQGAMVTNQAFSGPTFLGYPVYLCPGMPEKCIVATYKDNIVYGSNNATDFTEVRLIPTYEFDGSDNIRIVMQFALGVQVAVAGDGVVGYDFV